MTHPSIDDLVAEAQAHIAFHAALRKLRQLADESGASYDWLRSMHQGRITNPTVSSLQKILNHKHQREPGRWTPLPTKDR